MAEEIVIKVDNVSKKFRLPHEWAGSVKSVFTNPFSKKRKSVEVQHALKNISFEIKRGEFFGIVGRNGSGKSTLLKILAGIYQPTAGQVNITGRLVPFIELGVGFNPELSGRENVYLNGALLGFSEKEVDEFYDEVVNFAELERFMDQKLKNYSSGMQVRLAFSMAVQANADILLIDEVLAVGDADFQRKCFNYFKLLKKAGTTVILVTHDMSAVREYCDRAMLIEQSETKKIGDTNKVSQAYLKLFASESLSTDSGLPENRWGDGEVRIQSIKVESDREKITITETINSKIDTEACIVGMRIRNMAGAQITGTNTKLEKLDITNIVQGEELVIRWTLPNILSDGDYLIDSAIQYADGINVYDWWDEAVTFSVKKMRNIPYVTDPGFEVDLSRTTT